jgi:hypothetical protein
MAELYRLILGDALAGDVPGPRQANHDGSEEADEHDPAQDADLGPDVETSVENLTHRSGVCSYIINKANRLYRM